MIARSSRCLPGNNNENSSHPSIASSLSSSTANQYNPSSLPEMESRIMNPNHPNNNHQQQQSSLAASRIKRSHIISRRSRLWRQPSLLLWLVVAWTWCCWNAQLSEASRDATLPTRNQQDRPRGSHHRQHSTGLRKVMSIKNVKKNKSERSSSDDKKKLSKSSGKGKGSTSTTKSVKSMAPTQEPTTLTSLIPPPLDHQLIAVQSVGYDSYSGAPEVLGNQPEPPRGILFSGDRLPADIAEAPFEFAPFLGCSSLTHAVDFFGRPAPGFLFCLSPASYGDRTTSVDYPLHYLTIQPDDPLAPPPPALIDTGIFMDPRSELIWENGADIVMANYQPNPSWNTLKSQRVLTGADFQPQALEIDANRCAIMADGFSPVFVAIPTNAGQFFVFDEFQRAPDLEEDMFSYTGFQLDDFRVIVGAEDKLFCDIADWEDNSECNFNSLDLDIARVVKGGFGGMAIMMDETISAFLRFAEDTEPGVRVYQVESTGAFCGYDFSAFLGFYKLEPEADRIADVACIPGADTLVLVLETDDLSSADGCTPISGAFSKICIVDVADVDENGVMKKECLVDLMEIPDPLDADGDGNLVYSQGQVRASSILVDEDMRILIATDCNFPSARTNAGEPVGLQMGSLIKVELLNGLSTFTFDDAR